MIHNGVAVGTNDITIDNMLLAYRVTIGEGCGTTNPPVNVPPTIAIVAPTNATLSAPATVTLTASAYDQDGLVTNVNFYLGGAFVGSDTTFPFQYTTTGVAAGSYDFTAIALDQNGASATSAVKTVVVTVANLSPTVAITSPANGANVRANANLSVLVAAGDADGSVTNVELYEGATLIASNAASPFTTIAPNIAPGAHSYSVIVYDNQGAPATSSVVNVTAIIAPSITQQPQSRTNLIGTDATFTVTATGDPLLNYQWRFNGTNISNATNTSLTLTNVQAAQAGNYTVVITNGGGSVTSVIAVLVVNASPSAGPDAMQRYATSSAKVPTGELLLNDTDPDADPLTLVSVGGTVNASVTIEGAWVIYTPNAGFTNADTFTYSISDGRGGSATGVVTVSITTDTLPTFNKHDHGRGRRRVPHFLLGHSRTHLHDSIHCHIIARGLAVPRHGRRQHRGVFRDYRHAAGRHALLSNGLSVIMTTSGPP